MKVKTFIYAEDVFQENIGGRARNHVANPLNFIGVPFAPATFTFGILCGIVETKGVKGDLKLVFEKEVPNKDTENDKIVIGPIRLGDMPEDNSLPEHLQGFVFSVNIKNAIIREIGIYVSRIYLDNEKVAEFPIEVIVKPN